MPISITNRTRGAALATVKTPQMVLEIEDLGKLYNVVPLKKFIRYGDDIEYGDDGLVYGGFIIVANSDDVISLDGTTTTISQDLQPDRGIGSSISSMNIKLLDTYGDITNDLSPGVIVDDVLGRRCKVWLGFGDNTAFKEDYIVIFRGIVRTLDSDSGSIKLGLSHPDEKKRQQIYQKAEAELDGAIDATQTTITVDATTNFLTPATGPDGSNDTSLTFFVRIDDEIMQYTGTTGTTFTGLTRGALGTTAAIHDDEAAVESFYRLTGTVTDLSQKIMLSSTDGPAFEAQSITNFNRIDPATTVQNCIFFLDIDIQQEYGLTIGDYITTTGASQASNNFTAKQITDIQQSEDGSYMVIESSVTIVDELNTSATCDMRSQFDTLGPGAGLGMKMDEVDCDEHDRLNRLFLSSISYDFYLKDTVDAKEFLEKELYLPAACYSLPRKARASLGYHIGPLPLQDLQEFNQSNVRNPDKLKLRRSIGRNFYNTIIYKFDELALEEKFIKGTVNIDNDSFNRIKAGTKALVIESKGLRSALSGASVAGLQADRRLDRYRFGAQTIEGIKVFFGNSFTVEVGDIVLFNGEDLNVSNGAEGNRNFPTRMFEVTNKTLNIKTGDVTYRLTDTNFSGQERRGLISPSSLISSVTSNQIFTVKESFNSAFGLDEGAKWRRFGNDFAIKFTKADFSAQETAVVSVVEGNKFTLNDPLALTPEPDDYVWFDDYNEHPDSGRIKLVYIFKTDSATFDDGEDPYQML